MRLVRGLAADLAWRPLLAASARATVESSFEHAVNLVVDGQLLTVVGTRGRPAPGALLTTAAVLPRLPVGTTGRVGGGAVRLEGLHVDAGACEFFSCAPEPLTTPVLPEPDRLRRVLLDHAVAGSFVAGPTASPFARALRGRLVTASRQLQDALEVAMRYGDVAGIGSSVTGLVGLGVGLTPSGDDYLIGCLAALHQLGEHNTVEAVRVVRTALAAVVAATAQDPDRTTRVSRHFLAAAAEGRFHHDIARAATAALTPAASQGTSQGTSQATPSGATRATPMDVPFRDVVAIGSTSGTDALFGLVDTLTTCSATAPPFGRALPQLVPSQIKEYSP